MNSSTNKLFLTKQQPHSFFCQVLRFSRLFKNNKKRYGRNRKKKSAEEKEKEEKSAKEKEEKEEDDGNLEIDIESTTEKPEKKKVIDPYNWGREAKPDEVGEDELVSFMLYYVLHRFSPTSG